MDYQSYLKSDKWAAIRNERKKQIREYHKRIVCECCGKGGMVHMHHWHYPKGWDNDSVDNIVALCPECHKLCHDVFNIKVFGVEKWKNRNDFMRDMHMIRRVINLCKNGTIKLKNIQKPLDPLKKKKKKKKKRKGENYKQFKTYANRDQQYKWY